MAILTVGQNQQYSRLSDAVSASRDGDVLRIQAGTYEDDFATVSTRITIEAVGGVARLVANASPPDGKAVLTARTDLTLRGIEISGARVDAGNGAAVRHEGGRLVLDARRGVAQHVLHSIAASNASSGPRRALQGVVDAYTGDGGERWAAAMAGSHERGILLDAVRLEAAALTAEVEDVRGQTLTELAAASHALARADTLIRDVGSAGAVVPLLVQGER